MSDVVVSVTESTTAVTVTEQAVAVAITESPTVISTSVAGLQGATGANGSNGVGYTGVTSTTSITIGSGLKTFTLVSGNQGAFITGMRVRAIHSDTPTYFMEGTANYIGGGSLLITVDKFNGSGSHNSWLFAIAGEVGQTGSSGSSGVVSVTSPITNTGTSSSAIVGIDQTLLSLTRSQISDFTSGTVAVSGTASYATTSGTAVSISGSITKSQVSDFTSGTVAQATNASTAVYATTSGTATYATTSGTAVYATSAGTVTGAAYTNASNIFTLGQIVQTGSAANTGLVVKGTTSQTGNLQEWQNTGATVIASVTAGGSFYSLANIGAGGTAISTARLSVTGAASSIGVIIRAGATPGDIQQWQSSASAVLTSVNSLGGHVFASGSTAVGGAPVYFGTATPALLTSAVQGANEYDGLAFYKTPSVSATTGRAVDVATHYNLSATTFDFSTSATGQSILGGGTIGITLLAGSTYEVEYQVALTQAYFGDSRNITAGYTTTTISGSPVTNFYHIFDYGTNVTTPSSATSMSSYLFDNTSTLVVSAAIASGSRYSIYRAKGYLRVTGTGSVKFYPKLTPSATVPNNTIGMSLGSYFKITPIGNGTVTQVGAFA